MLHVDGYIERKRLDVKNTQHAEFVGAPTLLLIVPKGSRDEGQDGVYACVTLGGFSKKAVFFLLAVMCCRSSASISQTATALVLDETSYLVVVVGNRNFEEGDKALEVDTITL